MDPFDLVAELHANIGQAARIVFVVGQFDCGRLEVLKNGIPPLPDHVFGDSDKSSVRPGELRPNPPGTTDQVVPGSIGLRLGAVMPPRWEEGRQHSHRIVAGFPAVGVEVVIGHRWHGLKVGL